jgi:hypothetical protein
MDRPVFEEYSNTRLCDIARAAYGVLPEVMEQELGSAIAADFEEGRRIVTAKADRWRTLRHLLMEVK